MKVGDLVKHRPWIRGIDPPEKRDSDCVWNMIALVYELGVTDYHDFRLDDHFSISYRLQSQLQTTRRCRDPR